jgi:hypothetical protein
VICCYECGNETLGSTKRRNLLTSRGPEGRPGDSGTVYLFASYRCLSWSASRLSKNGHIFVVVDRSQ